VEHLHGAAGDAVGLAKPQWSRLLFDDAALDVGERRQLRRKCQPRRSAADDQDINLCGNGALRAGARMPLRRIGDFGIAGLEAVEMKLNAGRLPPNFESGLATARYRSDA